MKMTTFERTYIYLKLKYHFFVGKDVVAHESKIEISTLNRRIILNIGIPPYVKIGDKKNSKFVVNLVDLAYYLSMDCTKNLSIEERREYIYQYFLKKYPHIMIDKKDFSKELGVCSTTMGTYIKKGYVPRPKRDSMSYNSKSTFNVNEIADFFSIVNQTM